MKARKNIYLSLIGCSVISLAIYLLTLSPTIQLINDTPINLNLTRANSSELFTVKTDEFGVPITYDSDELPTIVNATSQLQILQAQQFEIQENMELTTSQLEQLKIQRNILIEEVSPYIENITKKLLQPFDKIIKQLTFQSEKDSSDDFMTRSLEATQLAKTTIEQYITNPNESTYEETLQTAFKLIDNQLAEHDVETVFDVASEFVQSGFSDTMIRLKLQESKELLQAFQAEYLSEENEESQQFKKTMRQQLATEDALDLKSLELDELALRLSGILDEIEQVTQ